MGRRKREQWPDGFYLLGRKKQQPQSGDEDPKNDQKENGPQAGNVGQQSNSVIDALLRYYVNGGGFKHVMDGELDGMATEQAYYALTAYYRFLTGKTNLYDMTDTINKGGDPVEVEPTVPATTEPAEVEPAKTNFPWWILVICVVGGCGLGMVIAIVIIPKFKKKD